MRYESACFTIPERLQVALHLLGFEPEVDGMRRSKRTANDSESYRFSMQPVSESCARWWTMSSPCSALLSSAEDFILMAWGSEQLFTGAIG